MKLIKSATGRLRIDADQDAARNIWINLNSILSQSNLIGWPKLYLIGFSTKSEFDPNCFRSDAQSWEEDFEILILRVLFDIKDEVNCRGNQDEVNCRGSQDEVN
ncbi:hypothetical protein WN943_027747 [Citrus x changshan-huyou]